MKNRNDLNYKYDLIVHHLNNLFSQICWWTFTSSNFKVWNLLQSIFICIHLHSLKKLDKKTKYYLWKNNFWKLINLLNVRDRRVCRYFPNSKLTHNALQTYHKCVYSLSRKILHLLVSYYLNLLSDLSPKVWHFSTPFEVKADNSSGLSKQFTESQI